MVRREGTRVRLFARNGHDRAARYPAITAAAAALQVGSFLIDGGRGRCSGRRLVRAAARPGARDAGVRLGRSTRSSDGADLRDLPLERREVWRCSSRKGVTLQQPSWGGNDIGWAPMPINRMTPVPRIAQS
jgi:hypothetical protein